MSSSLAANDLRQFCIMFNPAFYDPIPPNRCRGFSLRGGKLHVDVVVTLGVPRYASDWL